MSFTRWFDGWSAPVRLAVATATLAVVATSALPSTAMAQRPHTREGFWFNLGLGVGSLGCDNCGDERTSGASGQIGIGGTISQKVMMGAMSNGWYKSENGATLNVSTLTVALRFYPSATGGFYLTIGVGLASIKASIDGLGSETETGSGAMLGMGWDIRVGRNASITPFWNGFVAKTDNADANIGQIGVGITIH